MNRIQEAQEIVGNFTPPDKLHNNVALVKEDKTYTLVGIAYLDEDVQLVHTTDRDQQGYIADEISKAISEVLVKDIRYSLHPLQRSYDLVHAKTSEGEKFKERIMKPGWIYNVERFRKPNLCYPDSVTTVEGDSFIYDGIPIEVKINTSDIFDTLIRAGLFKKPIEKVWKGYIDFYNNNESSVRSDWSRDVDCFGAYAGRRSDRLSYGFAVFGKTDARVELAKIEVLQKQYEALLEDSKKLRELRPLYDKLKSQVDSTRNVESKQTKNLF